MIIVLIYCNLGTTPLWYATLLNVLLMVGVMGRLISSSALVTAIPAQLDRGAFMSINSSIQQFSGGIASVIAGSIITQSKSGALVHYNIIGYIVATAVIVTIAMLYFINKYLMQKVISTAPAQV
jgi:hypothetical protein